MYFLKLGLIQAVERERTGIGMSMFAWADEQHGPAEPMIIKNNKEEAGTWQT